MKTYTRSISIIHKGCFSFIILLIFVSRTSFAQHYPTGVGLEMKLSNNDGKSISLSCGVEESATDTLDLLLGERELPPIQSADTFDGRFVGPNSTIKLGEGSLKDIRKMYTVVSGVTLHYRIKYQAGLGNQSVSLKLPPWFSNMISMVSINGKSRAAGDSIVSTSATGFFDITVEFNWTFITFRAAPSSVSFRLSNKDTKLPEPVRVYITPSSRNLSWDVKPSDGWISVNKKSGFDSEEITVSLTNNNFPAGITTGSITIWDGTVFSEATRIPVEVVMTLSTERVQGKSSFSLGELYPQPVHKGQFVTLPIELPENQSATCIITDVLGRVCRILHNDGLTQSGKAAIEWDIRDSNGHGLPSGVYNATVQVGHTHQTKRIHVR